MKINKLYVWSPAIFGVVLLLISQLDLYLFKAGMINANTILAWELVLVVAGMLSAIVVFIIGIVHLVKRKWGLAVQALINPLAFIVLFSIGGSLGAAYLNVT